jgi:probable FeS assembly SUF system protein SufT
MSYGEPVVLRRDLEASVVPVGTRVTLQSGETAYVTQALGGSFTIVVNGNMFRVDGKDADALGLEAPALPTKLSAVNGSPVDLERQIWELLKSCYDPEIPVNIVDLGLVYDCIVNDASSGQGKRVDIRMTLTAPGCGMGPVLQQDVQTKVLGLEEVQEVNVELVWDPPWSQGMMTEAAKLELGLL